MPAKVDVQRKTLELLATESPRCGNCGHIIIEVALQPGTIIRHRCKCNTWTYVYVVGVASK